METVRVIYHHEADGWWAESPDISGWSAASETFAELLELVKEGVPFALGHDAEVEHFGPAGEQAA